MAKINGFFKSWTFVDNTWFFMACTGVAVLLWVISASVALNASSMTFDPKKYCKDQPSSTDGGSDSDSGDDVSITIDSPAYHSSQALTAFGVLFLIFIVLCMYSYGVQKSGGSSSSSGAAAAAAAVEI